MEMLCFKLGGTINTAIMQSGMQPVFRGALDEPGQRTPIDFSRSKSIGLWVNPYGSDWMITTIDKTETTCRIFEGTQLDLIDESVMFSGISDSGDRVSIRHNEQKDGWELDLVDRHGTRTVIASGASYIFNQAGVNQQISYSPDGDAPSALPLPNAIAPKDANHSIGL